MHLQVGSDTTGRSFERLEHRLLDRSVPSLVVAARAKLVNRRHHIVVASIPAFRVLGLSVAPLAQILHRGGQAVAELRE